MVSKQEKDFLNPLINRVAYLIKKGRKENLTDKESVIFSCFADWKTATDFKDMEEGYIRTILRNAKKANVLESKTIGKKVFYRVSLKGIKFPLVLNGKSITEEEFRQTGQTIMLMLLDTAGLSGNFLTKF